MAERWPQTQDAEAVVGHDGELERKFGKLVVGETQSLSERSDPREESYRSEHEEAERGLDDELEEPMLSPEEERALERSTLFIGDLGREINEPQLIEAFQAFGDVVHVDIKRDRVTRNNLGYGFVQFKNREVAEEAKKSLHGMQLGSRKIRIGWAQKNTSLFVSDLDASVTSERLREIFSAFGPIYVEATTVKHNKYGLVRFKKRSDAEKAKTALDGEKIGTEAASRPVRISWGDANMLHNCVHFQFETLKGDDISIEDIEKHFGPYGEIVKISLPKYEDQRGLKGYGFVHFSEDDSGEASAAKAIAELHESQVFGKVTIRCNFGKRQQNRRRSASKRFRGHGHGHVNQGGGAGNPSAYYAAAAVAQGGYPVMLPVNHQGGPPSGWAPLPAHYQLPTSPHQHGHGQMQNPSAPRYDAYGNQPPGPGPHPGGGPGHHVPDQQPGGHAPIPMYMYQPMQGYHRQQGYYMSNAAYGAPYEPAAAVAQQSSQAPPTNGLNAESTMDERTQGADQTITRK